MNVLEQVTLVSVSYQSERMATSLGRMFARFPHSILVDNGSGDATIERVRSMSPRTRIVALSKNHGFGYGNNRGVEAVTTKYALLINPDCQIEPDAVEALVRCAEAFPRAVGVSPHTFDLNGRIEIPYQSGFLAPTYRGPELPIAEGPVSARAITGSCILINVDNFKTIGMYDENLFMYYEEYDLGLRATGAGYDMISTPEAKAIHIGNASSPATPQIQFLKNFHVTRSKLVMTSKYKGRGAARLLRWRLLAIGPIAVLASLFTFRREVVIKWAARFAAAWSTPHLTASPTSAVRSHLDGCPK
jgi:GT2 family glycosyltransferase